MFAICVSEIWKTTPFMSLLLLAGLSQISEDMIEAAKVDGATWWQRLFKVILPNMRAAIMVAVLFRALDAFRIFDNIYVMTRGAQNTESVSFLTYRQIIEQFELGLGSALSVLLFLSRAADRLPAGEAVQGRSRLGARGGVMSARRSQSARSSASSSSWCGACSRSPGSSRCRSSRSPRRTAGSPQFLPKDVDARQLRRPCCERRPVQAGAAQLVRHLADRHGAVA